MPFCRDCGFEVQKDWVACPKCGGAQGSALEERIELPEARLKVSEAQSKVTEIKTGAAETEKIRNQI